MYFLFFHDKIFFYYFTATIKTPFLSVYLLPCRKSESAGWGLVVSAKAGRRVEPLKKVKYDLKDYKITITPNLIVK